MKWVQPKFDVAKLKSVIKEVDSYLSERDRIREEAIKLSRDVVRASGWAITSLHKGDLESALKHMENAERYAARLKSLLEPYPELLNSGFANNAFSEYVEAKLFIDIVLGKGLSGPEDLNVGIVPYLQGIGDLVGELRRLCLDLVRHAEFEVAWRLLEIMEAIYLELRSLDYPEALIPGVRHKADVARRLVDDTKALLADLESRHRLERSIKKISGL